MSSRSSLYCCCCCCCCSRCCCLSLLTILVYCCCCCCCCCCCSSPLSAGAISAFLVADAASRPLRCCWSTLNILFFFVAHHCACSPPAAKLYPRSPHRLVHRVLSCFARQWTAITGNSKGRYTRIKFKTNAPAWQPERGSDQTTAKREGRAFARRDPWLIRGGRRKRRRRKRRWWEGPCQAGFWLASSAGETNTPYRHPRSGKKRRYGDRGAWVARCHTETNSKRDKSVSSPTIS